MWSGIKLASNCINCINDISYISYFNFWCSQNEKLTSLAIQYVRLWQLVNKVYWDVERGNVTNSPRLSMASMHFLMKWKPISLSKSVEKAYDSHT